MLQDSPIVCAALTSPRSLSPSCSLKIILINIGGGEALQRLLRRGTVGNACTMQSGNRDSQPGDSPCNLENMPCGLAVITLAQREARPQPIWRGEQPSLSLPCFISPSEIDSVPPEEASEAQQREEEEERERKKKLGFKKKKEMLQWLRRGKSTISLKAKWQIKQPQGG